MNAGIASKVMFNDLAMRLERTARATAADDVQKALDPVVRKMGDELREALRPVVGRRCDMAVVEVLAKLHEDIRNSATKIAEADAIDALVATLAAKDQVA